MHVVHTVGTLGDQHGGPSRSVTSLCSALAESNMDVELFTLEDRDKDSTPILPASSRVQLRVLPGHQENLRSAGVLGTAVASAVRNRGSLIHEHGMWLPTNHAVAAAARRTKTPRIVSPRGMLSTWALGFRRWKKSVAWQLYQRRDLADATLIHVTSAAEAAEVRARGLLHPIAVIPNGVDLPPAGLVRSPREDGTRRALFLSRIHPVKGVLVLVEAWSRVRPSDWKLTIAGPDDAGHLTEVKAAVAQHGLSACIELTGAVNDASKWLLYASSDLFILPTFSENFGVAIAEALASALPVITTTGAPWPGITAHRCGWRTDPGVDALERALREATASTDDRLRQIGQRGRDFVITNFSWGRISEDMKAVYQWLLQHGERPSSVQIG